MALNYLPRPLSSPRFLELLSAFAVPLPESILNERLLPVLDNFTAHYSLYSQDSVLCHSVLTALSRFQMHPTVWPTLQAHLPANLPAIPAPPSPSTEFVEVKSCLWSSQIAPESTFPPSLFSAKELTLLRFIDDVCRDRQPHHFLLEMQDVLIRQINDVSLNTVLTAIKLLAKEGLYMSTDLVKAVEDKIMTSSPLTRVQFWAVLTSFKQKGFYGRARETFWRKLSGRLEQGEMQYAGELLYKASLTLFFESGFYNAMVSHLQATESSTYLQNFVSGAIGICLSPLATPEWLQWCQSELLQVLSKLSSRDIIELLKALMTANLYEAQVWKAALAELATCTLARKDIINLFISLRGLQMDNPAFAADLLGEYRDLQSLSEVTGPNRSLYSVISSQETANLRLLSDCGLQVTRKRLLDMYSADGYLPEFHAVVEILGLPYHVSQVDGSLDLPTQAKARHFLRQGYSVVLVTQNLSTETIKQLSTRLRTPGPPQLLSIGRVQACSRVIGSAVEQLA